MNQETRIVTIGSYDFDVRLYSGEVGSANEIVRCVWVSMSGGTPCGFKIPRALEIVGKTEGEIIEIAIRQTDSSDADQF